MDEALIKAMHEAYKPLVILSVGPKADITLSDDQRQPLIMHGESKVTTAHPLKSQGCSRQYRQYLSKAEAVVFSTFESNAATLAPVSQQVESFREICIAVMMTIPIETRSVNRRENDV